MSAGKPFEAALLQALTELAGLRAALVAAGEPIGPPATQQAVNTALNRVVRGFRDVEEAAATFDGEVDAATIAFISSNSSASNPDVLLQQRLQDALNAKFAAESRAAALTALADRVEGAFAAAGTVATGADGGAATTAEASGSAAAAAAASR